MMILSSQSFSIAPFVSAIAVPNGSPGSSTSTTFGYLDVDETTNTETWNDWDLFADADFIAATASIQVIGGAALRVSGSSGVVRVSNSRCTVFITLPYSYSAAGAFRAVTGYTEGTPPGIAWSILEPLVGGSPNQSLFTTINHSTQTYVRNDVCFAAGFDWTGCPVWNSRSNGAARGTALITRRHLWMTHHFSLQVGDSVRFSNANGDVFTRTIVGVSFSPNESSTFCSNYNLYDMRVAALNADLDDSVASYEICGEWVRPVLSISESDDPALDVSTAPYIYTSGMATVANACIVMKLNQNQQVSLAATWDSGATVEWTKNSTTYEGETLPLRMPLITVHSSIPPFLSGHSALFNPWVSGDSGSPAFVATGVGEMALLTIATSTHKGMFPHADALNLLIASADNDAGTLTGYAVTVAPDPTA